MRLPRAEARRRRRRALALPIRLCHFLRTTHIQLSTMRRKTPDQRTCGGSTSTFGKFLGQVPQFWHKIQFPADYCAATLRLVCEVVRTICSCSTALCLETNYKSPSNAPCIPESRHSDHSSHTNTGMAPARGRSPRRGSTRGRSQSPAQPGVSLLKRGASKSPHPKRVSFAPNVNKGDTSPDQHFEFGGPLG